MIQHDYTIRDVFFQAVTGQGAIAALGGDDRGHVPVFKPAKETAYFCTQDSLIGEAGEQRFQRVEHHTLSADQINGVLQTDEQALQVILPSFLDFAALHMNIVEKKFFPRGEVLQVETQ